MLPGATVCLESSRTARRGIIGCPTRPQRCDRFRQQWGVESCEVLVGLLCESGVSGR